MIAKLIPPIAEVPVEDDGDEWIVAPVRLNAVQRAIRQSRFRQLQHEFPGQFVAYRELWEGDALQEPLVLAVGSTDSEVVKKLEAVPPELQKGACIRFLNPPGRAMGYSTK